MKKILRISKPSDYSEWVGQSDDPHSLISVIDYSSLSPVRFSLNNYDVYGLFLQGDDDTHALSYGAGVYDYRAGTLICVAPGQLGGKEDTGEPVDMNGWAVLFHPDILQRTGLEKDIKSFSFFDYRVNEALHMSEEERNIIITLIKQLRDELYNPSDDVQDRIIVGFLNVILRYCQRFYDRQFATRKIANNDVLSRFENLLKDYFDGNIQLKNGLPTMQFCARQLCMSSHYLGDLIKKTTGETGGNYIKKYIVRIAKNRLASGLTSSEVAYSLGFDYPQHFARMFKKITGLTPKQYVSGQQNR